MGRKFNALCMVVLLGLSLFQYAHADLAAVGPVNATNGFPLWYMDGNGVVLELCLTPGSCVFDPPLSGNIFSQQIGFGEKAFYWSADAQLSVGPGLTGTAVLTMGLVASFSGSVLGGVPASGEQITFVQITVGPINNLVPGSIYTVTHPFGGLTNLIADSSGVIPKQRLDIGCASAPCDDFTAALGAGIGPFLRWDPAVLPAPPSGFIGNPTILHKVVGSPYGTNLFKLEGPSAGGMGIDLVQTDLFKVQGKLYTGTVPMPLTIDRATFTRPQPSAVTVLATSYPGAILQVSGTGIVTTTMVENSQGKFFAHIPFTGAPPSFITVTASDPPKTTTTVKSEVVDVVTITLAEYNSSTLTLTIEASSSDATVPPVLTALGFGNLTSGSIVVSGILVPPPEVIVGSSAGGSDSAQVFVTSNIKPIARNDSVSSTKNTAVPINVLANDTAISGTLDPATVTIVAVASNGTTSVNPATGVVTYTPNLDFVGKDSFNYTVQDSFVQVSNVASVAITVVDSEVLTVSRVEFTRSWSWWRISGKSSVRVSGNVITLYVGPDTTGPVIGTATVNALGSWSFSKIRSPVDPGAATTISVKSSLGTEVLAFPITFR